MIIHKLPSQCDVSIPQEYKGHYGIDIGGLSNFTYKGDCSKVTEMDIASLIEKYHDDLTENLENEFDEEVVESEEESSESDSDSSSGSKTGRNSFISSDDSSLSSKISMRSSTSVASKNSISNSSSDSDLIMIRPGQAQLPQDDDRESDIEHIALVNPDSPNGM